MESDDISKLDPIEADKICDLYKGIQNKFLSLKSVGNSEALHKLNLLQLLA